MYIILCRFGISWLLHPDVHRHLFLMIRSRASPLSKEPLCWGAAAFYVGSLKADLQCASWADDAVCLKSIEKPQATIFAMYIWWSRNDCQLFIKRIQKGFIDSFLDQAYVAYLPSILIQDWSSASLVGTMPRVDTTRKTQAQEKNMQKQCFHYVLSWYSNRPTWTNSFWKWTPLSNSTTVFGTADSLQLLGARRGWSGLCLSNYTIRLQKVSSS